MNKTRLTNFAAYFTGRRICLFESYRWPDL